MVLQHCLGNNDDGNLVEVHFSKRPNRHVLGSEKPEGLVIGKCS